METDKTITIKVLSDIPLGHKIALNEIKNEHTILKSLTGPVVESVDKQIKFIKYKIVHIVYKPGLFIILSSNE